MGEMIDNSDRVKKAFFVVKNSQDIYVFTYVSIKIIDIFFINLYIELTLKRLY